MIIHKTTTKNAPSQHACKGVSRYEIEGVRIAQIRASN
jgi:hypothetical protein